MNSDKEKFVITMVDKETETQARNLIIKGLSEHFDKYDASKNPDLDNINESYIEKGYSFFVALYNGIVIGTGALIKENDSISRIVRVSVDKSYRGKGVAKKILTRLEQVAKDNGDKQIILETNNDWYDAIGLYRKCGYVEFQDDDNIQFIKNI